ncbi:MAG TPA: Ada metal-binding domain-containing protein [Gordonia sp. (in: high G+C Gram-positive bacteria)]|uniref:DNA-3-methyladenine glycosylase 2 family protein n=1 Tax=unclassified Gordonia (in: high G+C Gram-positive bacteria) TaxID=2657482 RepID=UPI000FA39F5C|nr:MULTISPECIES: Ada metal-binding domain-containing protein [unclassified Gordonia (in: high G+C Gram-positive bacteria)]RUP41061.1 MAG: DNA-3-methyladenine glycosylase 2 family protein [Gordonia sp. (in: high G+C Gram-positive bacteria)]HNP58290.1 Ada metal-binding domain-containing protein [Gordonia sp. (in: high G+C Gram-positive bacteria)]HRC52068.1 Ada metal-binding domain-containing protein [Gordonia sp. (in: high G+C Gram-positive bacteria)]
MTTTLDFERCYRALESRDARFDGQFVVTVSSTGIYCRPSCPARTPKRANVAFVPTAAAAQRQGFRACRRCVPDAVPGSPRWDHAADVAARAMRLIADGVVDRSGVTGLAAMLGYSPRQLERILTAEFGAGPLALARAQRAANARVLITRTDLAMTDIAYAAGFASVRQFNDTIRSVFDASPSQLRRTTVTRAHSDGHVSLRLPFRAPLNQQWLQWHLRAHAIPGHSTPTQRILELPHGPALAGIAFADDHVQLTLHHLDLRDLGTAVSRVRRLLDLDADIEAIDVALFDGPLGALVRAAPGVRVPGSCDPFASVVSTMVGQQISTAAARTHLARLVAELGEPTPWTSEDDPVRRFPTPAAIAESGADVLRGPRRRIDAIVAIARAVADGEMELHAGVAASDLRVALLARPGIGTWTADYLTMTVAGDPDILLDTDLVVRNAAAQLGVGAAALADTAPWRSYASMHLWRHALLATPDKTDEGDLR